jgi:hypothetical protein
MLPIIRTGSFDEMTIQNPVIIFCLFDGNTEIYATVINERISPFHDFFVGITGSVPWAAPMAVVFWPFRPYIGNSECKVKFYCSLGASYYQKFSKHLQS